MRETFADVEARPIGMHKVGGTARAEHTRSACRAGRIQSDRDDVGESDASFVRRDLETIGDLLQANVRTLFRQRRMFTQSVNEKVPLLIDDRIVDGGSAQIHSGYDFHGIVLFGMAITTATD